MEYTEKELERYISSVAKLDPTAMEEAEKRQGKLAKPPGSLGMLEELSIQLAGITGKINNRIKKKRLLVFASDNGVVCEGVSCAPQKVTLMQTINLTRGKTGAAALARHFGCELDVIDMGVNADIRETAVKNHKIAYGTNNIAIGPAMTRADAVRAILTGLEFAKQAANEGVDAIGIGEMGIGNTTTSSAVLAAITGAPIATVTGRGGGITEEGYITKLRVIKSALEINKPDGGDPIDTIAKVGGFDIAAMAGAFIGAAFMRIPAVIDGFISAVAAVCAVRMCPDARGYLVPSHASYEIGYKTAIGELGLKQMFTLGMRLGEGSGCPFAFEVLDASCAVINDMATFDEAGIDDGYLNEIRNGDKFTVTDTYK